MKKLKIEIEMRSNSGVRRVTITGEVDDNKYNWLTSSNAMGFVASDEHPELIEWAQNEIKEEWNGYFVEKVFKGMEAFSDEDIEPKKEVKKPEHKKEVKTEKAQDNKINKVKKEEKKKSSFWSPVWAIPFKILWWLIRKLLFFWL